MKNISFVIPAFNSHDTLAETIESIFNGNFTNGDEIIIVEDYSSDKTLEIAEDLSKNYSPNIKIIKNTENKGCPASRNIGIRETKNDLIFSLDADNILEKNSVEKLKKALIKNEADIVSFSEAKFFIDNKNKITHKWKYETGWFTIGDLFSSNINPAPGNNILFTKKAWEKTGGFIEIGKGMHEAWIFILKQLESGSKFYVEKDTHYYHRYGHESLFTREKKKNVEKELLERIVLENRDLFSEGELDYILKNNPAWFHTLKSRPIKITEHATGHGGRLIRTPYGIYKSIINRISKK